MPPRSQPYRIEWPLNPENTENIDEMFQILFDDVRNDTIFPPKTANTVLHVNADGMTLEFTKVNLNLATDVSGTLPVTSGGTGTATAFTPGSVVFAGPSGVYAQDNANFFWDDANNRLGIGLANPSALLTLSSAGALAWDNGAGAADTFFYRNSANVIEMRNGTNPQSFRLYNTYTDASNNERLAFGWASNVAFLRTAQSGTGTARDMSIGAGGINYITVQQGTGNVGIGIAVPLTKLHVQASQSGLTTVGNARIAILDNSSGSANELQEVGFGYKGAATYQPVVIGHKSTSSTGNTKGDFYIATRDVTTDTAPTERLYIKTDGSIGIGLTAPLSKLHIDANNGGAAPFNLLRIANATHTSTYYDFIMNNDGVNQFLQLKESVSGAAGLTLNNAGNIGIGQTSPTARLHIVAGTASASSAPLKLTSGTLLTAAEAGAIEFLTDAYYGTITTGTARKTFAFREDVAVTQASGKADAQTAAVTSVTAFTVGATSALFVVAANINVTTSTLHNFTTTVSYTDETNTARVLTLSFSQLTGAFVTAITNATGAGAYEGIPLLIRAKNGTGITMATTGTFTTVTYNVSGSITQIALT